jgi:hypothetical protein
MNMDIVKVTFHGHEGLRKLRDLNAVNSRLFLKVLEAQRLVERRGRGERP